ncbi:unnamed protein product, partial [marine sediment metagenome]
MNRKSPDWSDPMVVGRNKEPAHATLIPYADENSALKAHAGLAVDRELTPFRRSLDGLWQFYWAPAPAQAPAEFHLPDYDTSEWDEIEVPSNWQLQGEELKLGIPKYDVPIYTCEMEKNLPILPLWRHSERST